MLSLKKKIPSIVTFLILLNSLILLIPNKFKAYPIVLLLLMSIVYSFNKTNKKKSFPYLKVIYVSVLIFIYLISLFYSQMYKEGFSRLSTMSSLLAFPLIFGILSQNNYEFKKKTINYLFGGFIISNMIFICLSFIYFIPEYPTISETIIHYSNLINIGLGVFSIHPIYMSIYIGIAILLLLQLIKESEYKILKIFYFIQIIFFFVVLAVLMRKGPILYLIITISGLMISYFQIKKTIFGLLFFILITFLTIQFLPKYKNINRFQDLLNISKSNDFSSSTVIRKNIYICSITKIKEKPVFGYGVGNTQSQLDPCYIEKGIDLSLKTYNCHNQYFSILLTSGCIGLFIYLFSLFKIFKTFYENKNFLAISVLSFFLLNFLTENVIERENGMLLYSFIISFFIFNPKYQHDLKSLYEEN